MMPMVPGGVLTRRGGHDCGPVPFAGRRLAAEDLADVIALHHAVRATIPPELVCFESDVFFADRIDRAGCILGLFAEGKLIAYGVLGLPSPRDPSFGDDLALPAAERGRIAEIDGASVTPEWRGNGLQRLLIGCRLRWALAAGRPVALSTVAPGNLPSLHNLLAERLTIRALRPKYGGLRYVVRRDLDLPPPRLPRHGRWIGVDNRDGQATALARGEIGWALSGAPGEVKIWYGAGAAP